MKSNNQGKFGWIQALILPIWMGTACKSEVDQTFKPDPVASEAPLPTAEVATTSSSPLELTGRVPLLIRPGTTVTLSGNHIRPTLTLAFGGEPRLPVAVTVASDASASFVAPDNLPHGALELIAEQEGVEQSVSLFFNAGTSDYPIITADPALISNSIKFYDANGVLQQGTKGAEKTDYPVFAGDASLISSSQKFYDTKGILQQGTKVSETTLAPCAADGATGCAANDLYPSAKLANLLASDLKSGVSIAGVSGTLGNCATDGAVGCVVVGPAFKAADTTVAVSGNIRSGVTIAGAAGSIVGAPSSCGSDGATGCLAVALYPAATATGLASKVLSGQTVGGVAGNVTIPAVGNVLSGLSYGVSGTGSTGSLTVPAAGKVLFGSGTYGVAGTGTTPTLTLPSGGNVLTGSGAFGDPGAPVTPSLTLASAANVRTVNGVFGVSGTSVTPTLADCSTNAVTGCVTTAGYQSADLTNLAAGNVKRGVALAGVTGNFPSATSLLPRYSDNGGSTTTTGIDETDLTLFATQLTSAGTFEYWDSTGIRRTGSGDADITAANVKNTVIFENLSVTGTYAGSALGVWDVRAGVDRGDGTLGKLKVNCRNAINNTYYNYDGVVGSIPSTGVTSGTTYDIWDTIDDHYGQPASTGFPSAWSVANNYCGGVETVANDDKVWKDVTTAGCGATNCRYKDKISGLEWTKTIQTSRTWPQAINDCAGLTHDGVSGWRLPTQKELEAAYTHGAVSAASANWITSAQMQGDYFWSSSTSANGTTYAWVVTLAYGDATNDYKAIAYQVACVK